jgi:hypothetical protein
LQSDALLPNAFMLSCVVRLAGPPGAIPISRSTGASGTFRQDTDFSPWQEILTLAHGFGIFWPAFDDLLPGRTR